MDKKPLLTKSLARILKKSLEELNDLVHRNPHAEMKMKSDGTPVTTLDEELSDKIYTIIKEDFPDVNYYSEENFGAWTFPLIAVDPLDGTQEYLDGRDEWALSIGYFENDNFKGEGWVYNPKTQELFEEEHVKSFTNKNIYRGEVSRSEWKKGLFTNSSTATFKVEPIGSIAYKLGRLSQGKCDFVISLRPKNIWDIAGGTLLCQGAGYKFYSQGKEVTSVLPLYRPPLIWCHESLFSELSKIYP